MLIADHAKYTVLKEIMDTSKILRQNSILEINIVAGLSFFGLICSMHNCCMKM